MTKASKKRLVVDWASIYPNYGIGTMSNPDIVNQYKADHVNSTVFKKTVSEGAIRKMAKLEGWKKSLAGAVQAKIKEKLVRVEIRDSYRKTDDQVINEAADKGVDVVVKHRIEIKRLDSIEEKLIKELENNPKKVHVSNYQGKITQTKLNITIMEKTASFKNLTGGMTQRIALERQAHNINDDAVSDDKKRIRVGIMEIND